MADEIRLVSLKRGFDPRHFTLIPFGGGGPVCGWAVAAELEIATVLVPMAPGALCAYGLTVAALEYDEAVTVKQPADSAEPAALEAQFRRLEQAGLQRMQLDGVAPQSVVATRSAEMRYIGQSYELSVPMASTLTAASIQGAVEELAQRHQRIYGHANDQGRAEFVNLRVAHGHRIDADTRRPVAQPMPIAEPDPVRRCYFRALGGMVDTRIVTRAQLGPGDVLPGPAVIHQADTTTVVGPGFRARVDAHGNLILSAE
jgi:N-methylhydantoinase A